MEKMTWSEKSLRKPVLLAALLLTAFSVSGCIVPRERGDRGGWDRHHYWTHDDGWNQDDGWHRKKRRWN